MVDQERHVPLAETCNQCLLIWSDPPLLQFPGGDGLKLCFQPGEGEVVNGELPAQSWAEGKLEQLQPLTAS